MELKDSDLIDEPVDLDEADSDDEALRQQNATLQDRLKAKEKGLSTEEDMEWKPPFVATLANQGSIDVWEVIEPDALPCGVVPEDEPEIVEHVPEGIEMEDIGGTDPMEVDDAMQGVIDVNDDDDFSLPVPSAGGTHCLTSSQLATRQSSLNRNRRPIRQRPDRLSPSTETSETLIHRCLRGHRTWCGWTLTRWEGSRFATWKEEGTPPFQER